MRDRHRVSSSKLKKVERCEQFNSLFCFNREKCYFNTVYKNRCMEETEEVCEEKCDDEGENCEPTEDCQELMKTVCGEVAEPEEESIDTTI